MRARVVQAQAEAHNDDQPRKQGIWFSERLQAATWRLNPGQAIVAHCHPESDELITVVSGTGDYLRFDDQETDPSVRYVPRADAVVVPPPAGETHHAHRLAVRAGSIALTPAGCFHALVNTGTDQLVLVVATAPDPSNSVYTVRGRPGTR